MFLFANNIDLLVVAVARYIQVAGNNVMRTIKSAR